VQAAFAAAADLPAGEREAFLARECGDDPALVEEVRALLREDDRALSLLDRGAPELAQELVDAAEAGRTGQRIGPWRLQERIGHGGMGSVYLAERADGELQQRVALKIIRRGMDSDEILGRFRAERQILARLDHPNIARFLDGGLTDDGVPWFTMEHVDGVPVDRYCDEHGLSVDERLALFDAVCRAVAYAQRNLVVHRDLKPGNILVTADGTPKLLDFGIAKLLADDGSERLVPGAPAVTRTGHRVMTPGYAAPEQVRGGTITTATDVYALGVILYELLTGQRPYAPADGTAESLEKAICEELPSRPSTVVTRPGPAARPGTGDTTSPDATGAARRARPAQLRRKLAGDLDNICLMALRKEPERRYGSAEQLADDVALYRAGRPVHARPDTVAYRVRKFVTRNRVGVVTAALVLGIVVSLVSFYTSRLATERDRARLEAEKARSVAGFLTGLFEIADPTESMGETITARELLDRGAAKLGQELQGQPAVRATLMDVVGTVYHSLGLYARADSLLGEAVRLRRVVHSDDDADLAESLNHLGRVRRRRGDYDEAEKLLRESLDMRVRLFGRVSDPVAESLADLSWLYSQEGKGPEAEPLLRESIDIGEKLRGERDRDVLSRLSDLALLVSEKGDHHDAERIFRRTVRLQREVLGEHPDLATTLYNFSEELRGQDHVDEAERVLEEALAIDRKVYGDAHPNVAYDLTSLGRIRKERYDYTGADNVFREVLESNRRIYGEEHSQVARTLADLGGIALAQARFAAADSLLRASMEMHLRVDGPDHPILASRYRDLGRLEVARGNPGAAVEWHGKACDLRRRVYGEDSPQLAETRMYLALALKEAGRLEEAVETERGAFAVARRERGDANRETLFQMQTLGELLTEKGDTDEAARLLGDALRGRVEMYGADHPLTAATETALARLERRTGRLDEAEERLRHALVTRRTRLEPGSLPTARTLVELGRTLAAAGKTDEAERDLGEALEMLQAKLPADHPRVREAKRLLADLR